VLSQQSLNQAQYTLDKINRCLATLSAIKDGHPFEEADQFIYDIKSSFLQSMEEDLKISGIVSSLLATVKTINRRINQCRIDPDSAQKILHCFKDINSVLQIFDFDQQTEYSDKIHDLIKERDRAREQNDWELSDKIREELAALGISVHDKKADI
jgi:cysteinyl-tRNA synthetase